MANKSLEQTVSQRVIEEWQATLHRPHIKNGDLENVSVRIEYDEYEPSEPEVSLLHPEFSRTFGLNDIVEEDNELKLTSRSPFDFPIRFWGITNWRSSGDKLKLGVTGYDVGCSADPLPTGEEVTVFVYLTGGRVVQGLRMPVRSYDGTITMRHVATPIEWQDERGTTTLRMQHEYEDTAVGINKAILQIARPIVLRTFAANGTQSLIGIIEQMEEDLRDILILLSLCSRETVRWFQIMVETYKSQERPRVSPRAKRRGRVPTPGHREHDDPLIDHRDLIDGGFKRLLDQFRASQHREMLRKAITSRLPHVR